MNRLEHLRADVNYTLSCYGYIETEMSVELAKVLATFIAELEPVEVDHFHKDSGAAERWFAPAGASYGDDSGRERTTIFVPRKPEPTLLKAAEEAHSVWSRAALTTGHVCDAMAVLRAAIERESDNG